MNTQTSKGGSGQTYSEAKGGYAVCPAGYYCTVTSATPIQCPAATYCPEGTTDNPIDCPENTFSPPGSNDSSKCTSEYPLGYYVDTKTGKLVQCPTGAYCTGGAKKDCASGTYNMKKGMGDASSCLQCPKGSYCASPTSVVPCDAGTYNNRIGQSAKSACVSCPAGTFCANKGTVTPSPCAAGTFSSSTGVIKGCDPVQAGYYLPNTGI